MKLIEDFYDIIARREEEGATVFEVALRPDCKVYEGHFPEMPVAPGVCNLQMIRECAEQVAGHPLMLNYIANYFAAYLCNYPLRDPEANVYQMQNAQTVKSEAFLTVSK